uniref:Radical SAM protein n=1 Tax=Ignisphaera aggregans TaxID=334771 RepID=A0A7C2V974_9CREN
MYMPQRLAEEGLKRVNVSLPTLNKEKYRLITNRDALEEVINGIRTAYDVGLKPITLNVVVLRGVTKNEYEKIIDFASSVEGRVRLIELEPFGMGRMMFELLFEPVDSIVEQLEEK